MLSQQDACESFAINSHIWMLYLWSCESRLQPEDDRLPHIIFMIHVNKLFHKVPWINPEKEYWMLY